MDRIFQPNGAPTPGTPAPSWPIPSPSHALPHPQPHHPASASAKTPGDYLRALRRRAAVAVAVAVAVGVAGASYVVRQPNVYRASAQIKIDPPQSDPGVAIIVPGGHVAQFDSKSIETYVPNRIALLRGSKSLAERAVSDPDVRNLVEPGGGDPAGDLMANLSARPLLPATNAYEVSLEGRNPERVAKLLNALLELFRQDAKQDNEARIFNSAQYAGSSLKQMTDDLKRIDADIKDLLSGPSPFAPGGVNLQEARYRDMVALLAQKRARFDDLIWESRLAKLHPAPKTEPPQTPLERRVAELMTERRVYERREKRARETLRNFIYDPAYRHVADQLKEIDEELAGLRARLPRPPQAGPDLAEASRSHAERDILNLQGQADDLLASVKDAMPDHQRYLNLLQDRERKVQEIAETQGRLSAFKMLASTQSPPIRVESRAVEPSAPVRPKRAMMIAVFSVLGLALGSALVCFLEFLDHRVKVPEHLTAGLTLPLLGVIPRIRRLAGVHRGGHLWTPGAPASVEADAYRNLRASLLGLAGPKGPIVTLLITSAKAGEGKSTTALNLAATCARSGERTLLVDVDLRRPSLGEVFLDAGYHTGLVDVLRGDLPWQRTVVHTDLPNLDFLPTGDPAEVPIEILGTLEIRQLLTALSGHYDRVILDGPAVLGLADCRMLGRMVDSAILVVRSGAHELRPLQRAKAMLEQSRVALAGIVFNGVAEDYENWSSYGAGVPCRLDGSAPRGLDAAPIEPAALAAHSPGE